MKYKEKKEYAWLLQPAQTYCGPAKNALSYVYTSSAFLLGLVTVCAGFVTPLFLNRALKLK